MTLEEALQRLKIHKEYISPYGRLTKEAIDMAIEALEKQIREINIIDEVEKEK